MGQKDKKAKTAEQKARVAAKQNKKAAKKEKKTKSKDADDSDAEDEDLESVLEEYARKQAQFLKVTETVCEPPGPRSSATIVGSPASGKELFLFGGEYFNGALATFYNDLFVYHTERDEWRLITSPNSPLPRSGHAWCRGGNAGGIYLFGGEFSSPKQGTFYHYNDFWRLDPSSREWTRIESKSKGPPARSGHRMTYFKSYIFLFGGFQDTSQQTKYLQDLWIYDCQNFIWHNPVLQQKPDARSSFSLLPHESGAVLYGGYSRVKTTVGGGTKSKGANQVLKAVLKPVIHQDTWFLRVQQAAADSPSSTPPVVRWERRKRPVNAPNPPRAGATQAYHKGRGIMFGGVHDVEESEEGIESEFFNSLFVWNVERNRFFPLSLRKPKAVSRRQADDRERKGGRAKADEAELLRNLAALETTGSIQEAEKVGNEVPEEESSVEKPIKPVLETYPHARFNAQLAVQGDNLYIFGGTYEQGDREITFAEMHSIDLGKLDGVQEIFRKEPENWLEEVDSEDGSEDEYGSDEDDESDAEGSSRVTLPPSATSTATDETKAPKQESVDEVDVEAEQPEEASRNKNLPHPRPFEALREFFVRTTQVWQGLVLFPSSKDQGQNQAALAASQSVKELRKIAFERAESMWWDCREEVTAEEERQEVAGIGEVVSLADRNADGGSGGVGGPRRR